MSSETHPKKKFRSGEKGETKSDESWHMGSFGQSRGFKIRNGGRGRFQRGRGRGGIIRGGGRGGFVRGGGRGRGGFVRGRGGFHGGSGVFSGRGRGFFPAKVLRSHTFEVLGKARKLPLFHIKNYLQDPLPEYNDCSVGNLLNFLHSVAMQQRVVHYSKNDEFWQCPRIWLQSRRERIDDPAAKRSVFHKLLESISEPTLKDSLISATYYLCKKSEFMKLENEHPEWPKKDWPSSISVFKDEVSSDLGDCSSTLDFDCYYRLWKALSRSGKEIINTKMIDLQKKHSLAYAAFFKKHPELFPWETKTIFEEHTNTEDKDP